MSPDLFFRLRINDCEGREEDRKGFLSLVYGYLGQFEPILVPCIENVSVLVLDSVQVSDAVERTPYRNVITHLLGLQHQHEGIATIVTSAGKILGRQIRNCPISQYSSE